MCWPIIFWVLFKSGLICSLALSGFKLYSKFLILTAFHLLLQFSGPDHLYLGDAYVSTVSSFLGIIRDATEDYSTQGFGRQNIYTIFQQKFTEWLTWVPHSSQGVTDSLYTVYAISSLCIYTTVSGFLSARSSRAEYINMLQRKQRTRLTIL